MRSIEQRIRSRFPVFDGEPWYEALVGAYLDAFNHDDEYADRRIQDGIIETAMLRGAADLGGACGTCDARKIELRYDGDECWRCTCEHDDVLRRLQDERHRAAAMSVAEHREAEYDCRMFLGGLMSRDVQ